MKRAIYSAALLAAGIVFAAAGVGRSETKPEGSKSDAQQAAPTIVGAWRAALVSISSDDGNRKPIAGDSEFGGANNLINVIVSENKFTLRVGEKTLADMTYALTPGDNPCAIDLKSPGGPLLGIYRLSGNRLRIRLADAAQGRPKDFSRKSRGLDLVLRREEGTPLVVVDADGGNLHEIHWTAEVAQCGCPAWSPDGRKIAFHAVQPLVRDGNGKIFVIDAEGGPAIDLGPGMAPRWSPDGKRLAFRGVEESRQGICVIGVNGSAFERIDLGDPGRIGAVAWSPKGDELACVLSDEDGPNLCVYNLKTHKRRMLLDKDYVLDKEYAYIWHGFDWSPDGRWICYKASLGVEPYDEEAAVVSADGQKKGFRVLLCGQALPDVKNVGNCFAWEPNAGNRILTSLTSQDNGREQLYLLDAEGKSQPRRLAGQDPARSCSEGAWSPDGKRIVFCMHPR